MWQLISWKKQVLVIAAVAIVLAWGIEAGFEGVHGERTNVIKYISFIATIITLAIAGGFSMFWRFLWRKIPWIARKTFPDFNGTWQGTLLSTWIDPVTMQQKPAIPTTIWIRQTPFSMSIKLRTGESLSYSTRSLLEADHDAGRFRVWYSYDNQPNADVAYRSTRHEGVAWLEMDVDADPNLLAGQYYSSRRTTGDMTFSRVSRDVKSKEV